MTNIVSFPFNLQNVASIIAAIGLANGTILTLVTAYRAANQDGNVKECILYFISLLQSYLCLLVILPYSGTYHYVPLTCIIMVLCPLVKMCWKLIISSVLKFHFNPFTWDHILPTLACCMVLCIEKISLTLSVLVVYAGFMISLSHLLAFAYGTVNQIAEHLNISVFTIKQKPYENLMPK